MKSYVFAILTITSITFGAYYLIQGEQTPVSLQSSLTTVRNWTQCQTKVNEPCTQCPKYEHPICLDGFIDTNNCLLRDNEDCTAFWEFVYNPSNVDSTLPESMSQCIKSCELFAQKEKHLKNWFQQKFHSCAEQQ